MMYMCGTDLQSACVMDMYEMASVDVPDDVTIAVQAGGAYHIVLWNHGGSYNGVCFDETADHDSLTIHEVNDALYADQQRHPNFQLTDIFGETELSDFIEFEM